MSASKKKAIDLVVKENHLLPVTGPLDLNAIASRPDPGIGKKKGQKQADTDLVRLQELSYRMFAENRRSLLIVLQGIDASGKNGTTKHLARGFNPDALNVHSFGKPSTFENERAYPWRGHRVVPRRGNVTVFNRSHYEEVLVVKVHPQILDGQPLPDEIRADPRIFETRYRQINEFERMLTENGTTVVKMLLHISREEQLERFRDRLEDPDKNWKFDAGDLEQRKYWDDYMTVFGEMIEATSTPYAPWYVVPADRKWYRNLLVSRLIADRLEGLDMEYPAYERAAVTLEELERS